MLRQYFWRSMTSKIQRMHFTQVTMVDWKLILNVQCEIEDIDISVSLLVAS